MGSNSPTTTTPWLSVTNQASWPSASLLVTKNPTSSSSSSIQWSNTWTTPVTAQPQKTKLQTKVIPEVQPTLPKQQTTAVIVLPPQEDEKNLIEEELSKQSLYKTEMCRSFMDTGVCRYGQKCQFAHGEHELRPVLRHPKYKTEPCKRFATTGSCPYGPRCRFIHPLTPGQFQALGLSGWTNSWTANPSVDADQTQLDQQASPAAKSTSTAVSGVANSNDDTENGPARRLAVFQHFTQVN